MTASVLSFAAWREAGARQEIRRTALTWGGSLLLTLTIEGGAAWWLAHRAPVFLPVQEPPPAAIPIDLAPAPMAAPTLPIDVTPGPQQTLSRPVPVPGPTPKVTAPPSSAPNPPVPVPKEETPRKGKTKKAKPAPRLKQPVPDKTLPAEETAAPPSVQAPPSAIQATPAPGGPSSTSHDPVTWQGALLARLERFKRYPADAQADQEEGTAWLHFSMDRKGHVLSASIATSSGHTVLDSETLALVRRAEPLPAPPDEVKGDPLTLTVPVEFHLDRNRN